MSAKNLTYAPVADDPCSRAAGPQFLTPTAPVGSTRTPAPSISGANTRTTTTSGANARTMTTPVGNVRTSAISQHPVVANATSIPSSGKSAPVAPVVGDSANISQKWYCVTVGRQVGVFQGPYVFIIVTETDTNRFIIQRECHQLGHWCLGSLLSTPLLSCQCSSSLRLRFC